MPPLRPRCLSTLVNPSIQSLNSRILLPSLSSLPLQPASPFSTPHPKAFTTTSAIRSGHGAPHYDPPSGWLFGIPPGEKYKKEGWENIWVYGFWGSLLFGVVGYIYKPDTSIQTWALEEARRRLEAEGILPDPDAQKKAS